MMKDNNVQNLISATKFGSNFLSQKDKNVWFFDYHLLTCSVRKMLLMCLIKKNRYVFVV